MKFTDIKDKSIAELQAMIKDEKKKLFELKLKLKTMQLSNPNEISSVRKNIARLNTALVAKSS